MKFLLLLAVLVAASFAAPILSPTFLAKTQVEITTGSTRGSKITGNGTLSEDNDNQKVLNCLTPSNGTVTECKLTDYHARKLYVFAKDPDSGKVLNCTTHPLPANVSMYRNQWAWVPESRDVGSTTIDPCQGGETWELSFQGKFDLKVATDSSGTKPVATDYKTWNGTGIVEIVTCFDSFSTNIDPKLLTPPSSCKPGLTIDL